MLDTGSDTSLIKIDKLPYKKIKLLKPKKYNSLGGPNQVTHQIISPIPKEFKMSGTLEWKLFPLKSDKYDAIIGMNFLIPFKAKLDLENHYLEIFTKYKIYFRNLNIPQEIEEANSLEAVIDLEEEIHKLTNRSHLNDEEKQVLKKLLKKNKDLFFLESDTLSFTHEITHEIKTKDGNPIYCKLYRYPQIHEKEIERQIGEMLNQGIIRESDSPYNSPLWIVPKKMDNSNIKKWRIVIDYRKLNEITIDDKFPIPNIDSILDRLGRAQYFTTLDLAKGFHQILVKEEDQKKTAFSTPFGHYEYVRMPFGLKNAPATFQRLINSILREYMNKICVVYLDDILIFSSSLEEHVININKIFNALRKANLKIQIDKCNFFYKETEYLGHVLTPNGMKPNPNKLETIKNLKLPESSKQIKSFLGVTGYYRKFVKDYAKVAKPMTNYLKKGKQINKSDPLYISSFEELKSLLTSHPILKYPDFNKPFKINTDASQFALGAVLLQEGHPIAYASRTLNTHEIRYGTPEKELLGVVWACKHFRPYIYGKEFLLQTDHEALKWLHTKYLGKDLNPRLQRWILSLGEYNIKIDFLKGKDNKIADFLSRINSETNKINGFSNETDTDELEHNVLENNDESSSESDNSLRPTIHSQIEEMNDHIPIMDTIVNRFKNQIIITSDYLELHESIFDNRRIYLDPNLTSEELVEKLKYFINKKKVAIYTQIPDHDFNTIQLILIKEFPNIKFIRCSHFAQDVEDEEELNKIISINHKQLRHPGMLALYQELKFKIYSINLKISINKITNNCDTCCRGKYDRKPIKAKFHKTEIPNDKNQIIHMDIYTNTGNKFITFIDKFSKFAVAYPIGHSNHTAIIQKLRLYFNHKKPKKIIADNGFKDVNIADFLREEEIEIHLAKPHSHTGNSDVERLHNTLNEKVRILNIEQKRAMSTQVIEAVRNYNSIFHTSIQYTPNQAENDTTLKDKVNQNLLKSQEKRLEKHNRKRENYEENREEGYIKYYKSLRHKGQPKYRKYKLANVHPCNIKRPLKFTGNNDPPSPDDNHTTDIDSTSSGED